MPVSCKCILDHLKHKGAITEKEYDKLLRNLKGTVWHPYPQEKPKANKEYNITLKYHTDTTTAAYFTEDDTWHCGDDIYIPRSSIIAWAELPERYKEEESDNKDTSNKNDVIIVQIDRLMPMQNALAFRKDLLDQMKDGIVVIPPWAHVAHVGDECKIEIKEMEEESDK